MSLISVESSPVSFQNSSYPLNLEIIAPLRRISPELAYHLIHTEIGLQVPGSFTEAEAKLIQHISRNWNWRIDKQNKPACAAQLLHFLEQLCAPSSLKQEVEHELETF